MIFEKAQAPCCFTGHQTFLLAKLLARVDAIDAGITAPESGSTIWTIPFAVVA